MTDTILKENLITRKLIEERSHLYNEPEWMLSKRLRSWMIYQEFLEGKKERIDFSHIDFEKFVSSGKRVNENAFDIEHFNSHKEERSGLLTSVDGTVKQEFLNEELRSKGVIVTGLHSAMQMHPKLVEKYFMNDCVQVNDAKQVALHAALWDSGMFVYVPKNITVTLPIQSHYLLTETGTIFFPHIIIVVEEGSTVTLVDTVASNDEQHDVVVSGVTELFIGEGSRLNFVALQEFGENVIYRNYKRAIMKKDSNITWIEVALGGKISHENVEVYMEESGTHAEVVGIYFAEKEQKMSFNTLQKHIAPHAISNLLFKGVLTDKAETSYQGLVRVHKGAQKTDAYQKNQNILLSLGARADALPELEIEADDVRCTHGATTGPINKEDLFYLMSRGLTRKEATYLLTIGFFSEAVDQISVPDVREEVMKFIEKRMEQVE